MTSTVNYYEANYLNRHKLLNPAQRQAVNTVEGPVAVIAGPGTGKTELLAMRIANILRTTDTSAENILCLTYTDSGAHAMRQRLLEIVGPTAHRINIYTFHSFGSMIMSQNVDTFFNDIPFKAASSLNTHQVITDILENLPHGHILASKNQGEFVKVKRIQGAISNLKRGGLTPSQLQEVIVSNQEDIKKIESILAPIVEKRIGKNSLEEYSAALLELNKLQPNTNLPNNTPNLTMVIKQSLLKAISQADELEKNTPLSKWKSEWFEKDPQKRAILKTRKRLVELEAIGEAYKQYIKSMERQHLYDYDDMILMTLKALRTNMPLRYSLQEQFQHILIDEFQDTNQAQLQIIYELIDNDVNEGRPNIFIVGDDDQAIYGFQGANSSNITTFLETLPATELIVLTDNYRSSQQILDSARSIITQGEDRLENSIKDLNKTLTARSKKTTSQVNLYEYENVNDERQQVANKIKALLENNTPAQDIVVIARKHQQLIDFLPYLNNADIPVAYEKHDDALKVESIMQIELLANFFLLMKQQKLIEAQALLPELLAHPAWQLSAETFWNISLHAHKNKLHWLEALKTIPETTHIYEWLITTYQSIFTLPLEQAIDVLIGTPADTQQTTVNFTSPIFNYYFSNMRLKENPASYLTHLNALSAIRSQLREHLETRPASSSIAPPNLEEFVRFLQLNRTLGEAVSIKQVVETIDSHSVNLMTAHKSKGLEFKHVFIIDGVDSKWGSSMRGNNQNYKFPENLHLNPAGDTMDEKIRLFYVAATRAKETLNISYSLQDDAKKGTFRTSFLDEASWRVTKQAPLTNLTDTTDNAQIAWHQNITTPNSTLKNLLAPSLKHYRLNTTALGNFIDLMNAGPQYFLMQNLLHFPKAPAPSAAYGTAIHRTLQKTHLQFNANGRLPATKDVIELFATELEAMNLTAEDYQHHLERGIVALEAFIQHRKPTFKQNQQPEVNFNSQNAVFENVPLTGNVDVFEIDKKAKTITITDYKTGKPSPGWGVGSGYEAVKLHKYKQQLMFYQLLIENSRDYSTYKLQESQLAFVEPDKHGEIHTLTATFSPEEYAHFKKLVKAVYQKIINLDLPDVANYTADIKGIKAFEQHLTEGI